MQHTDSSGCPNFVQLSMDSARRGRTKPAYLLGFRVGKLHVQGGRPRHAHGRHPVAGEARRQVGALESVDGLAANAGRPSGACWKARYRAGARKRRWFQVRRRRRPTPAPSKPVASSARVPGSGIRLTLAAVAPPCSSAGAPATGDTATGEPLIETLPIT